MCSIGKSSETKNKANYLVGLEHTHTCIPALRHSFNSSRDSLCQIVSMDNIRGYE